LRKAGTEALVALDANVLLNLYRYPENSRQDLLSVLRTVRDRLFIPYQAALEYQRNRLHVIASQRSRFDEVRKVLNDAQMKLRRELENLQLTKRHSSIDPTNLLAEVDASFKRFMEELDSREKDHLSVTLEPSSDPIRETLDIILAGRVGKAPDQKELDKMYEDGKTRYADRRPPGYLEIS
jgi:PIN like domain